MLDRRGGAVGFLHSVETSVDECEKGLWLRANRRSGLGKPQVEGASSRVGLWPKCPTGLWIGLWIDRGLWKAGGR